MAGFSSESKPITKFVESIEEHEYVLLNAVGPIGVAVFLTFISDWWTNAAFLAPSTFKDLLSLCWSLIWNPFFGTLMFFVLTVIGALGQAADMRKLKGANERLKSANDDLKNRLSHQEAEKESLDNRLRTEIENNYQLAEELIQAFKKTAHLWTCQIFNELQLTVKHRISIYYLDSEQNNLVLLDRFAKNHDFNSVGRPFFPRQQGVIGKAWANGECIDKKIPIVNRKDTAYYQYLNENYDIPRDVSSRLRMNSCTIAGFAIEDVHGHHTGVIIFESQDQNDFVDQTLRNIAKRENVRLQEFIADASSRDLRPLPSNRPKGVEHESKVA